MPPQPEPLIVAYRDRYNRLRTQAGLVVAQLWDRLDGVDVIEAERFASQAAAVSSAAQGATASAVDGYLAAVLRLVTGDPASVAGIDPQTVSGAAVRAGATPEDVYLRPVITARTALSKGRTFSEAMAAGKARAVATAEMDVSLTQRATTMEILSSNDRVVGYRRTLTGVSCPLCQVASTQRYRTDELMPIHNHCDCGVSPIIGQRDPGQVVNRDLLRELKQNGEIDKISRQRALPKAETSLGNARNRVDSLRDEIKRETDQERETRLERRLDRWQQEVTRREKRVADLREERKLPTPAVHQHGELGPVLTDSSHDFAGPADIAA